MDSLMLCGELDSRLVDLVGIPFVIGGRSTAAGLDCWGAVLEAYRRLRPEVQIPDPIKGELPRRPWTPVRREDRRPMDVCIGRNYHAGIYLGNGRVLHASEHGGVMIVRAELLERAGLANVWLRPESGIKPLLSQDPAVITITTVPDPLVEPGESVSRTIEPAPGCRLIDIAPRGYSNAVGPHGWCSQNDWSSTVVQPGDHWMFLPVSRGVEFLIGLAIMGAAMALQYALTPDPVGAIEDLPPSGAFSFEGLRNTAAPYLPIPSIYGTRRTAGNYIQAFYRVTSEGVPVLHLLSCLSQGPIHSIAGLTEEGDELRRGQIPDDIQIEENPASYYPDVQISVRQGNPQQSATLNFDETIIAQDVGVTLENDTPVTVETNTVVDAVEFVIEFPQGLGRTDSSGEPKGLEFEATALIRRRGNDDVISRFIEFKRKHLGAAFSHAVRVDVSQNPGIYSVELTRTSPAWPDTGTKQSKSVFRTLNEITYVKTAHPGLALLAAVVPSLGELQGKLVNLTALVKGRYVWIWDGVSTTNPTFTYEWSDNPAWCIMDAILDPVNGLGRNGKATLNNIDLQAFKDWADYCDTTPNVNGEASTEPRARLDYQLDEGQDAWDTLQKLAKCAWGRLVVIGDKISVIIDKVRTPVALFNESNVWDFQLDKEAPSIRSNRVEVEFENEDADYSIDLAAKQDDTAIIGRDEDVRTMNMKAPGVTRSTQAFRLAKYHLNKQRGQLTSISFSTGLEATGLIPGDVIYFGHRAADWGVHGRIVSSTSDTVTLDRDVIVSDGDKIMVRTHGTGSDVLQERTVDAGGSNITFAAGDAIDITSAWNAGDLPAADNPWAVGETSEYVKAYEITKISIEQRHTRRIDAIEYSDDFYSDDPGEVEDPSVPLVETTTIPDDVTNLSLVEYAVVAGDGTQENGIDAYWTRSRYDQRVDVYFRIIGEDGVVSGTDWTYVTRSDSDQAAIRGLPTNTVIEVAAVSVSPSGATADVNSSPKKRTMLYGRLPNRPGVYSDATVRQQGENIVLRLPEAPENDVVQYDVRWGSSYGCSKRLGLFPPGDHSIPMQSIGETKILIRPINRQGVVGAPLADPLVITTTNPAGIVFTDISDDQAAQDFPGTKSDTIVSSGTLLLDVGSALTGTYESPVLSNLDGIPRQNKPFVVFDSALEDTPARADECPFAASSDLAQRPADAFYLTGLEHTEAKTTGDLYTCPCDGLIASIMRCDGNHVKVQDYCEPSIEIATSDSGSGAVGDYADFTPGDYEFDSVQLRVTLQTPHARLIPKVQEFAFKAIYNKTPVEGADINAAGFVKPVSSSFGMDLIWSDAAGSGQYEEDRTLFLVLSAAGSFYQYYALGERYTVTTNLSIQISDVTGIHMIYMDSTGLHEIVNPTDDQIDAIWLRFACPAFIYWNSGDGEGIPFYEMHGCSLPGPSHVEFHDVVGMRYESGFGLSDILSDEDGSLDSHAQFTTSPGVAWDEDVQHTIGGIAAGATNPTYPILYRDTNGWRKTTNPGFPVLTTGSGRIAWNNGSSLQEATNGYCVLYHVFATNQFEKTGAIPSARRVIVVVGQNEYANPNQARDGAQTEITNLALGGLPIPEMTPIGSVIVETKDVFTNSVKGRIRVSDTGEDWYDFRGLFQRATGTIAATSDHGLLVGLTDDDHTLYSLADGTRAFTGTVVGVYPTDPSHLATKEYVDDEIGSGGAGGVTDHGALTGLDDPNDHSWAFLVDGTRALTGDLNLGGNDITTNALTAFKSGGNGLRLFDDATSGQSPFLSIWGYATGDALKAWSFAVGIDGAKSFISRFDGVRALSSDDTNYSVSLGIGALADSALATNSVAVGAYALTDSITDDGCTAVGAFAGFQNNGGAYNTMIGFESMRQNVSADFCTALGAYSLRTCAANSCVGIGFNAGYAITSGDGNTLVGTRCGEDITTGNHMVGVGGFSLRQYQTGEGAVAIGYNALNAAVLGRGLLAAGFESLLVANGVEYTTAVGYQSGRSMTTADYNTLFGYGSGYSMTTGHSNTCLGSQAGYYLTGTYNVCVGRNSMVGSGASNYNVVIGGDSSAGNGVKTGNVVIGYRAFVALTTGTYNVGIGYEVDTSLLSGSHNIVIGRGMGVSGTTASSEFVLGSTGASATPLLYGDIAAGKLGIGVSSKPTDPLVIGGMTQSFAIVDAYEVSGSDAADVVLVVRVNGTLYKITGVTF